MNLSKSYEKRLVSSEIWFRKRLVRNGWMENHINKPLENKDNNHTFFIHILVFFKEKSSERIKNEDPYWESCSKQNQNLFNIC